jgi:hypothetical protein
MEFCNKLPKFHIISLTHANHNVIRFSWPLSKGTLDKQL